MEGSEVSTFEEETGNLMQRYLDDQEIPECRPLYESEFGKLIKQLYEEMHAYTTDSSSIYNSVIEEQLLNDPNWLSIVSLAKKTIDTLNRQIQEVANDA